MSVNELYLGDCLEVLQQLPDDLVDTVITDPPYGLAFMGQGWDKGVPGVEYWKAILQVTKPGGMLLAFGGTRTYHRLTAAIEDAGWEIRDCMMWLYGSGFPKSLDISKAIDKAKGAEREVIGKSSRHGGGMNQVYGEGMGDGEVPNVTAPSTNLAREWNGWGTALKPAWEPIIVAMKPLDGTFAHNAEKWGVAGINVDGGRVGIFNDGAARSNTPGSGRMKSGGSPIGTFERSNPSKPLDENKGRWPANLILDEDAAAMLDAQSGFAGPKAARIGRRGGVNPAFMSKEAGDNRHQETDGLWPQDNGGGASRFFYCAKASKSERNRGCEALPEIACGTMEDDNYEIKTGSGNIRNTMRRNFHPTVKPLALMEYLCTLTKTPTGGIVLDPFAGSGSTLLAAKNTAREYIGIEKESQYYEIIKARLAA